MKLKIQTKVLGVYLGCQIANTENDFNWNNFKNNKVNKINKFNQIKKSNQIKKTNKMKKILKKKLPYSNSIKIKSKFSDQLVC